MRSRRRSLCRGFTLFEVLAAVLILGLLYTVLAESAIRGLRSEGMDRRRAEAALVADRQLVDLETLLQAGAVLEPAQEEREEGDYRVVTEILSEDIDALLPPPESPEEEAERSEGLQRLLVDDAGNSRVYRLRVAVRWEEAGEIHEVLRSTWSFDRSDLAGLFPAGDGEEGDPGAGGDPLDRDGPLAGDEGGGGSESGGSEASRSSSRRSSGGGGNSQPGGGGGDSSRAARKAELMRLWQKLLGGGRR